MENQTGILHKVLVLARLQPLAYGNYDHLWEPQTDLSYYVHENYPLSLLIIFLTRNADYLLYIMQDAN